MRYLYDLPIVPKVRAWLEIGGTTGDGMVNVGENTTLRYHSLNELISITLRMLYDIRKKNSLCI